MMEPVPYTGNMVDLSDLDADGVRSRRGNWDGASNEMRQTGRDAKGRIIALQQGVPGEFVSRRPVFCHLCRTMCMVPSTAIYPLIKTARDSYVIPVRIYVD